MRETAPDDIKRFLRREGVDLVGFTSVKAFENWGGVFHRRLADGTLPSRYGQEVCPHNRDVPTHSSREFPWLNLETLAEEAIEDPEGLNQKLCRQHAFPLFSEYTVSRTIAINLGNWGAPKAFPLLRGLQESRWPEVAEAARWALQRIEE